MVFAGIDYGSKLAGTTAIAWSVNEVVQVALSEKKNDADQWLLKIIEENSIKHIFIDAPLSIPFAYINPELYRDYFFRTADRLTGAMSPMFLGGLTARAMQLSSILKEKGIDSTEVYPAQLKKVIGETWLTQLSEATGLSIPAISAMNNHRQDALLAWMSGWRYWGKSALIYGDPEEGVITV